MSGGSAKKDIQIGDEMPDGTILAGYCEGKPLYATPADAPGTYTSSLFNKATDTESNAAVEYAQNLHAHGHHDFHVPSIAELGVLWENRDKGKLKGTFNETGSEYAGWYWSSSPVNRDYTWAMRFSDRHGSWTLDNLHEMSLRCVR